MRTENIELRVMPDEKTAFKEAASLSGIGMSSWIRERLRMAAIRELEGAGISVPFAQRPAVKRSTDV